MNFSDQPIEQIKYATEQMVFAKEKLAEYRLAIAERDATIRELRIRVACVEVDNDLIRRKLSDVITAIADAAVDLEKIRDE